MVQFNYNGQRNTISFSPFWSNVIAVKQLIEIGINYIVDNGLMGLVLIFGWIHGLIFLCFVHCL